MEKVELKLLGISYNPVKDGAFPMLLAQVDGPYRLPVIIGSAEAQSIAVKIEGIMTPRPLTHDLFCSLAHAFKLQLVEVFIYRLENSIFYSEMAWSDGTQEIRLEARTSDAVAIAIRVGAPIYTTREILEKAGSVFEERDGETYAVHPDTATAEIITEPLDDDVLDELTDQQLQDLLDRYIDDEKYEEAARVSEILKKRKC